MKVSNRGDSDNHSLIFVSHFKELECLEQFAVAGVLSVGAILRGRPPPGTHIGVPLRLLQRFLATIGRKCEFCCFLPLCPKLRQIQRWGRRREVQTTRSVGLFDRCPVRGGLDQR